MRVTKKMLQARLIAAIRFQKCRLIAVPGKFIEEVRNMPGLVTPEQYAIGQVPMPNEIGRCGNYRYFQFRLRSGEIYGGKK